MKNKTALIIGGSIVAVGAILIIRTMSKKRQQGLEFVTSNDSGESQANNTPSSGGSSVSSGSGSSNTSSNPNLMQNAFFPLKNGSRGREVVQLQKFLNDSGYAMPKLVEDGIFGSKTESVVTYMYNFPLTKELNDYIEANKWASGTSVINKKEVNRPFFDIFIAKTKPIPVSATSNPLVNPFTPNFLK
jgi:hypothetical protein